MATTVNPNNRLVWAMYAMQMMQNAQNQAAAEARANKSGLINLQLANMKGDRDAQAALMKAAPRLASLYGTKVVADKLGLTGYDQQFASDAQNQLQALRLAEIAQKGGAGAKSAAEAGFKIDLSQMLPGMNVTETTPLSLARAAITASGKGKTPRAPTDEDLVSVVVDNGKVTAVVPVSVDKNGNYSGSVLSGISSVAGTPQANSVQQKIMTRGAARALIQGGGEMPISPTAQTLQDQKAGIDARNAAKAAPKTSSKAYKDIPTIPGMPVFNYDNED